ncbi:hypothetical protein AHAS_Ahas06G0155100 [Arachis hypogaea]
MNDMRKGGIGVSRIHSFMVSLAGGYHNVPYTTRDMHNVNAKKRREGGLDAESCLSQIKSAIKQAFPEAHHRLCTWHLLRNATSNIGKPKFTRMFRDCMLGDYEVRTFQKSGLRWLRNLASPIKDGYRTCMRKGTVGPQHTYGESSLPDFEQHQGARACTL